MAATEGIDINAYVDWLDEFVIEATGSANKKFLYNLWFEIVPFTPVKTGLAMFSWRMTPGQKSNYKPSGSSNLTFDSGVGRGVVKETRIYPEPEVPNLDKYKRMYKHFYLFNNQNYVASLNDDETKYYYQFIDDGIRRAIAKTTAETK